MSVKITDKVYRLKQDATIKNGLNFKMGEEFHIVYDVVYMKGFPLPAGLQPTVYNWIINNPKLFKVDGRQF